jgi:hypothetical protein
LIAEKAVGHAYRCILDHRPRVRFTGRCQARNGSGCAAAARGINTATMAATMSDRLDVTVTYDARHGYIASAPELHQPIVALSLAGLRKRIEIAMLPDSVDVRFMLDGLAERERHRRRAMGVTAARS